MKHISQYLQRDKFKASIFAGSPVVRTMNGGDWYWINRNILKVYGRTLGPAGLAVYNVLASLAHVQTQTCFPTQAYIASRTSLSRMTVGRKIRQMKQLGLIDLYQVKGRWIYVLLETGHVSKDAKPYTIRMHPA